MRTPPQRIVTDPTAITYTAVVPLPPDEIAARLLDPHRHHEIDGSGSVQAAVTGPHRLGAGDVFTTSMRMAGVPYSIRNTVTEAVDGGESGRSVIEWRHPAGHRWRWEVEPVAAGPAAASPAAESRVTESWITQGARLPRVAYTLMGAFSRNDDGIRRTLERLQRLAGEPASD